jgi:hypothetical protein
MVNSPRYFFGLLRQRTCWVPTFWGWLAILFTSGALGTGFILGIHPFLSPTHPLPSGALIIEGWADDVAFADAIKEINLHHYSPVFVTGGDITKGSAFSEFGTIAEMGATTLRQMSEGRIEPQAIPSPSVRKDRTYASALALREWMEAHGGVQPNITLFSVGPHTRRSWLLFRKVFGDTARVGVIASPPEGYDPKQWWRYSEGFRSVVDEAVAYLYARLLFGHIT